MNSPAHSYLLLLFLASIWLSGGCTGRLETTDPPNSEGNDIRFIPDAGVRIGNTSIPRAGIDPSGTTWLVFSDEILRKRRITSSANGLQFGTPNDLTPLNRGNDPQRTLLPNGTWRVYGLEGVGQNPASPSSGNRITSGSSTNGIAFYPDTGNRYTPAPGDFGQIGVFDIFTDKRGGVVLLYIGDLIGGNNIRHAYSADTGRTFTFQHGNVMRDDGLGGPNTFVDPFSIRLPDGRIRLFTMKANAIYSHISNDDGLTFTPEPGPLLRTTDFKEFTARSLNDPSIIRLPDGRYRMYVASHIEESPGNRIWKIISATTPLP